MRSWRNVSLMLVAATVVAPTLGVGAIGLAQDASPVANPAGSPAASPVGSPVPPTAGVTIEGVDIAWVYNGQRSAPGQPVRVDVSPGTVISLPNSGAAAHNFVVDAFDSGVIDMPVGGTVQYTVPADVAPGEYEFICNLPGHAQAGMIGILVVG